MPLESPDKALQFLTSFSYRLNKFYVMNMEKIRRECKKTVKLVKNPGGSATLNRGVFHSAKNQLQIYPVGTMSQIDTDWN